VPDVTAIQNREIENVIIESTELAARRRNAMRETGTGIIVANYRTTAGF
jgi:hypothetical protein